MLHDHVTQPAALARTACLWAVLPATLWLSPNFPGCRRSEQPVDPGVGTATVQCGDLSVEFRDNAQSPQILSGIDRMFHLPSAPEFDAFDPHDQGSSAGLNFEHIISGHNDPANWFAPRHGPYPLYRTADPNSVLLVRRHQDDPWLLESSMRYTVTAPHYVDFEFNCRPHDARRFGQRGYAVLFWADYMHDVADVSLHFRGVPGPAQDEQWVAADAPEGHPDHVGGGTYRSLSAPGLEYDDDHNLKLNMWSYEYPRFTRPFYYGRAEQGMTLMLMFDRAWSEEDEIRFSLFKFKVGDQIRRPAWDFQYVIHRVETGQAYGFRGRLVWKPFVSEDDCLREYETWAAALPPHRPEIEKPATDSSSATEVAQDATMAGSASGWQLPPTGTVARSSPSLLNYFHMELPDGRVDCKEERLAQWNVLILSHDIVEREQLSLAKMRETNPQIKILAWVPLQGPHDGLSRGIPAAATRNWLAKRADGTLLVPHWGGHLMNPYIEHFAWPRHVLDYVSHTCLTPAGYDGLMMDCLWESEPDGQDVNHDGVHDERDTQAWQEGLLFLLRELRTRFPDAILVGNGGGPWSEACPYFEYANGCMHENALGDQFGGVAWQPLWDGFRRTRAQVQGRDPFHLIAVDVRAEGRTHTQAAQLTQLTDQDRRRTRLGLATSLLMDGGYFAFDRGDCLHGQLWWLPEYDGDLGIPSGSYETDRYGPGILSRAFTRGLVLVNSSQQEVQVTTPKRWRDVTSGEVVTALEIPAQDARILVGE